MTVGDLSAGLNRRQYATSARGTPYRQTTKHSLVVILKPFVLRLIEDG